MHNSSEFNKLIELEGKRKITIGVNRNHVNNFWYHTTVLGKIFNLLTYLFIVLAVIIFIKFGILFGIFAAASLIVYVKAINYISGMYARRKLFKNEQLFNAAYEAKSVTIKDNNTNQIIVFPFDWHMIIRDIN
ncbi:MAG: hypothetical protein Q7R97_03195 [Candidatus Daviesbacteria bacterium]|nr:hypothetical protein [Candidatus Daviesbacteria bacterium]